MEINPYWLIFCIAVPLFGFLIFAWGLMSERRKSAKKIAGAQSDYQQALSNLHESPGSEVALHETWRLGQAYADLVQFDKSDNFDEAALLRDLNATRPAASPLKTLDEAATAEQTNPAFQQLAGLKKLLDEGKITDAQYHEMRVQILDKL